MAMARELTPQQFSRVANVFLAIVEHCRLAVFAPAALADRACHLRLVDVLPTLDAVGATGIGQALALLDALLVGIVRQQDVADREIGGVQIVNVFRKAPAELQEAGHLGPERIADDQRVVVDRERRRGAELAAPASDGLDVPEIAVQDIGDQAQHDSASRRPRSHIRNRGRRCGGNISARGDIRSGPAWPRSGATGRDGGRGRCWRP